MAAPEIQCVCVCVCKTSTHTIPTRTHAHQMSISRYELQSVCVCKYAMVYAVHARVCSVCMYKYILCVRVCV